ncbi:hypothetical protein GYA93_16780 [Gordonia desulfuricans]|uniref:IacB protein n=1 Tax=Gordonia desulfuricans TaxID=89051 RepID=A0A7K3LSG4_9ACTN|nr:MULTISPECIES: hypothetical protein [Gordonia]EMP15013.1 iacB [Gordonia sp. NB41Y]NDK91223.1 hypothetical protein [Gordonia desulfuricans]WLP88722.1 hypothetical protein Q9K23_13975 [Gordonia sp. NB41Y]
MTSEPLRTLFCVGNNQNFFDLPKAEIGPVWEATQEFLGALKAMDGVEVIGTMDDDAHMVGPSAGWPWTFYVLADVVDQPTVKAACNLLRTTMVGEYALWKYFTIEARMGRELTIRDDVEL